jgi:acyl-coenzyme A thioesterase PaaI-like protein
VITEKQHLDAVRRQVHADCVVCSPENQQGMHLDFQASADGQVTADFIYDKVFEGYSGILHGGVISAVLDGAMTNCLFAQNQIAVTADFRIRFRHPVSTGQSARVRAWITRSHPPIFELKAEIVQNGQIKTVATAKFMEMPELCRQLVDLSKS